MNGQQRDSQRSRVYAAEQFLRNLFDHRDQYGPVIDFLGTAITLPPEKKFSSLQEVEHYVNTVVTLAVIRQQWGEIKPIYVRARRGHKAAHYEIREGRAYIALNDDINGWGMRELVVLHELAHHLCGGEHGHDEQFTHTFTQLVEIMIGPEAGYLLRILFSYEQVQ